MKSLKIFFNKRVAQVSLVVVAFFCALTAGIVGTFGINKKSETVFAEQNVQAEQSLENESPVANGNWIGEAVAPNYVQNMASGDKYTISLPEHLAWLAVRVNGGTECAGETYELTADIDLGGKFWTPIGNGSYKFNGTFIGNGHIISGMMLERSGALFYALNSSAVVKDVIIKNAFNASYALTSESSTNGANVYNCASEGISLANESGITFKHCSSNGTLLPESGTQIADSKYIGVNNLYIEFWIKYIDNDGTEHPLSYENGELLDDAYFYIDDGESAIYFSGAYGKSGWETYGYEHLTVSEFKISEYDVSNSEPWVSKLSVEYSDNNQKTICDEIKLTFDWGESRRGYASSASVDTETGVNVFHLAEIDLAHQSAIKIEVTMRPKYIETEIQTEILNKSGLLKNNFAKINSAYSAPNASASWNSIGHNTNHKIQDIYNFELSNGDQINDCAYPVKGLTNRYKYLLHRYGQEIYIKPKFMETTESVGVYTGIAESGASQWSNRVALNNTDGGTLNVRLRNLKLFNIYRHDIGFDEESKKLVVNAEGATSASYLLTTDDLITSLSSERDYDFFSGLSNYKYNGVILANLWLTKDSSQKGMNDKYIHMGDTKGFCSNENVATVCDMIKADRNNGNLYCAWFLQSCDVKYKYNVEDGKPTYGLSAYYLNPYTNGQHTPTQKADSNGYSVYTTYATFKLTMFVEDYGTDMNGQYALGVLANPTNPIEGIIKLYKQAKDHEGTKVEGIKKDELYGIYDRAVAINILSAGTYDFYAEEKKVQFNVAVEGGSCISTLALKSGSSNLINYSPIPTKTSPYNNNQLFSVLNSYSFNWAFSAVGHRFIGLYATSSAWEEGGSFAQINATRSTSIPELDVSFSIYSNNIVDEQVINLLLRFETYTNTISIKFEDENGEDPSVKRSGIVVNDSAKTNLTGKEFRTDANGNITIYGGATLTITYTLNYIKFNNSILLDGVGLTNINTTGYLFYATCAGTNGASDGLITLSQDSVTTININGEKVISQTIILVISPLAFEEDIYDITIGVISEEYPLIVSASHLDSNNTPITTGEGYDVNWAYKSGFTFRYKDTLSISKDGNGVTYTVGSKTESFKPQTYFMLSTTPTEMDRTSAQSWLDAFGKIAENYTQTITFIPAGINLDFKEQYHYNGVQIRAFSDHNTLKTSTYNSGVKLLYTGLNGQNVQFIDCDYYSGFDAEGKNFSLSSSGLTNKYSAISNRTITYYYLTKHLDGTSYDLKIYANYIPYEYTFNFTGGIDHTIKNQINGRSGYVYTPLSTSITIIYDYEYTINSVVPSDFALERGYSLTGFRGYGRTTYLYDIIDDSESAKKANQTFNLNADYKGMNITINLKLVKIDGKSNINNAVSSNKTISTIYGEWLDIATVLGEKTESLRKAGNLVKYWKDNNDIKKIARVKQGDVYLDTGTYSYSTSALTCEQNSLNIYGTSCLNFAPYWEDFSSSVITIYGYYVDTIVETNFDGRHLNEQTDQKLYSYYGSIEFYTTLKSIKENGETRKYLEGKTSAPTPSRGDFYTFVYWKAVDSDSSREYFAKKSGVSDSVILAISPITYYAYWDFNFGGANLITNNGYVGDYDSVSHDVINEIKLAPDMVNNGGVSFSVVKASEYTTYNSPYEIVYANDNTKATYTQRALYVPDSGTYTIKYIPSFIPIEGSVYADEAEFRKYILNDGDNLEITNTFTIAISPKNLSFGNYNGETFEEGAVIKMYDGDTTVKQVLNICNEDQHVYKVVSTYASANAGTSIAINCSVKAKSQIAVDAGRYDDYDWVYASYVLPNVTGTITPFEIIVGFNENIKYESDAPVVLISGKFNNESNKISYKRFEPTFGNESATCTLLGKANVNRIIEYTIKTTSGKIGTYIPGQSNGIVVEFTVKNSSNAVVAEEQGNYTFVFPDGTKVVINGVDGNEIYIVFIAKESFVNNQNIESLSNATSEISNATISMSGAGVQQVNEIMFTLTIASADNYNASFTVNINSLHTNWWHEKVLIKDKNGAVLDTNGLFKDTTGGVTFDYTFTPGNRYEVDLVFTNQSKITYNLGLIGAETAKTNIPQNKLVATYNSAFTLPTAERYGLTFSKWLKYDGTEFSVGGVWSVKGNITLYAMWIYNTTITLSAQDINRVYDPTVTTIFTYANGNVENTYLTYIYTWQKDGVNVANAQKDGENILIKYVADSGTYKFSFGLDNAKIVKYTLGGSTVASIVSNIAIKDNNGNTYDEDKGFVVTITPCELVLSGEINKTFDGKNTKNYIILVSDVVAKYSEVVGKELLATYQSANAGAEVISVVAKNARDSVLKNYTFKAMGIIEKLDVTISINPVGTTCEYNGVTYEQSGNQYITNYTGNVVSIAQKDVTVVPNPLPGGISISGITITTASTIAGEFGEVVGEYSGIVVGGKYLILNLNAVYNGSAINSNNFNAEVVGSIIIVPAELTGISINWETVYNTENQNITVCIFDNTEALNPTYYTVTRNGSTFSGATNAGTYDNVTVKIMYPNYRWYTETGDFIINAYSVYVHVTNTTYSREYNAETNVNLVYSTDYKLLVSDDVNSSPIENKFILDINTETDFEFNFADKNVATNKNISLCDNSNNYIFTLVGNVSGTITKKDVSIKVDEISKVFDGTSFTISYTSISVITLAGSEQLQSGDITINVTDAKEYDLSEMVNGTYRLNLFVNDAGNNLTVNYNVIGLTGTIEIIKADVSIVVYNELGALTDKNYTYSGTTQNIMFKATRNSDNADISTLVKVDTNTGVNVGEHGVTFAFKNASDVDNYNTITGTEYEFSIIAKQIKIKINEDTFGAVHTYDEKLFKYLVKNSDATPALCSGDNFDNCYFQTTGSYAWTYSLARGEVTKNIVIKDDNGVIIYSTSDEAPMGIDQPNYEISYDVTLKIIVTTITKDDIIANEYTYNGEIQDINFSALNYQVSFEGKVENSGTYTYYDYDDGGNLIEDLEKSRYIKTEFVRVVNAGTTETSDFKYASSYQISIASNMFTLEGGFFTIIITPKVITKESISTIGMVYPCLEQRDYDGTKVVKKTITSADIYTGDEDYINLQGEHSEVFGDTSITITFNNSMGGLKDNEFNLKAGSYVLANDFEFTGKIVEKEVTLTYKPKTIYYSGESTKLYVGDFVVDGLVMPQELTGDVTFNEIVNANSYNLGEQTNITFNLEISEGSSLDYYTLKFVGDLTLRKAQIIVSSIENDSYIYDATVKSVVLGAEIKDSAGAIPNNINPKALLIATYKLNGAGAEIEPINVGEYHIKPTVSITYANNFEYVGSNLLNADNYKLTIEKLKVIIVAGKTHVLYDDALSQYTYDIKDDLEATIEPINASAPISGHSAFGELIVNKASAGISAGVKITYTGVDDDKIRLKDFKISDGTNIFDANYDVTFDIQITYTVEVHDGDAIGVQKNELTYKAENLINEIIISVTLDIDPREYEEDIQIVEIKNGQVNDYVSIIGFYLTEADAQSGVNSQSEIKNATKVNGEYYAKTQIKVQNANNEYIYTKITVKQKTIYTLSNDGIAYNGKKVYDGSTYLESLSSSDICEPDKGTIFVKAEYPTANVGKNYVVNLSIVRDDFENYKLNTETINGEITPKKVQIVKYQDTETYYYLVGGKTINLSYEKFSMDATNNVLSGHVLGGTIDVAVTNSGNYPFFKDGKKEDHTTINLTVKDGVTDVTGNYEFIIDDYTEENGLMLVIEKAVVTINWNTANNYIYGATDYLGDIKTKLEYSIPDASNYIGDIMFEYTNAKLDKQNVAKVINAGTYKILSSVPTANYVYEVGDNDTITVSKKDARINIGENEIGYKLYNKDGYNVDYSTMVTEAFDADLVAINKTIYKISKIIQAGTTYYAQSGTSMTEDVVYSAITFVYEDIISNNYNLVVLGSIKITEENLSLSVAENLTYNATNQFKNIKLKLIGEDGIEQIFTIGTYYDEGAQTSFKLNGRAFTIDNINGADDIRNVGNYTINMVIDTVPKQVTVTIVPFALTINYQANKEYDGTNTVYGTDETATSLTSNAFEGDDIAITATYASDKYSETAQAIAFVATGNDAGNYSLPNDKTGNINKKQLVLELNQTLTYQYTNSYVLTYVGTVGVDADFISNETIPFVFTDATKNAVGTYNLTGDKLTLSINNFKVARNGTDPLEDTTFCYDIVISGEVTISAKSITLEFNPINAENKVVFDNTEKTITYVLKDEHGVEIDKDEFALVLVKLVYRMNNVALGEDVFPKGAGAYIVKANYVGTTNYNIVNDGEEYTFEITKHVYTVESQNHINSYSKEYNKPDPELTQKFTAVLKTGENYEFDVEYTREIGEELGAYDLLIPVICKDSNIEFNVDEDFLKEKFTITKNTTQIVVINLTAYNKGVFVRYYGLSNIGVFNLEDFTYTCQVGGVNVDAGFGQDAYVPNYENTVTFNSGYVGTGYRVNGCNVENAKNFTNFEVQTNLEFEIAKRTLLIDVTDDNTLDALGAYDKVYDGDVSFEKTLNLNYNSVAGQGVLSNDEITALDTQIYVEYNNANVDQATHLTATLQNQVGNFDIVFDGTTRSNSYEIDAEILPLDVEINVGNHEKTYGDALNIEYSVIHASSKLTNDVVKLNLTLELVDSLGASAECSSSGNVVVGTYNIKAKANNANFNITNANVINLATYTVSEKALTITFATVPSKTQDGTKSVDLTLFPVTIVGIVSGDIVGVEKAEYTSEIAGEGIEIIFTLMGEDSSNYSTNTSTGEIVERIIKFLFNYSYSGCSVGLEQIKEETRATNSLNFNYYKTIAEQPQTLPTPMYENGGYLFGGWSISNVDFNAISADEIIASYIDPYVEEINLYAIWNIQSFTITIIEAKYNVTTDVYDQTNKLEQDINYATIIKFKNEGVDYLFNTASDYLELIVPQINNLNCLGYGVGNINVVNELSVDYIVIDSSATLYIMYMPVNVELSFNANKGSFNNRNESIFNYTYNGNGDFVASKTLLYGERIGDVISLTDLEAYLSANRTGYDFVSWKNNEMDYQVANIAEFIITSNTEFIINWQALTFKLTLHSGEGIFEEDKVSASAWNYVDEDDHTVVVITTTYDQSMPEFIAPAREFYGFAGYQTETFTDWTTNTSGTLEWIFEIWTETQNIELFAVYTENSYTLTIKVDEHSTISVNAKNGNGVEITLHDTSDDVNVFVFNVQTAYSVTITAGTKEGYNFKEFVAVGTNGSEDANVYTIISFVGDATIEVKTNPRDNEITLRVVDATSKDLSPIYGSLQTEFDGKIFSTDTDGFVTLIVPTETVLDINLLINEGYKLTVWNLTTKEIGGKGTTGSFDNVSETQKTLSGFLCDITIIVELEPMDLEITVINNYTERGSYTYDAKICASGDTFTVKTGAEFKIRITLNYGYSLNDVSVFEFITGSANKGEFKLEIDTNDKTGMSHYLTLSKFTASGSFEIQYTVNKYKISLGYADYNEISGEFETSIPAGTIALIDGVEYGVCSIEKEFGSQIVIKQVYEKEGFKFKAYYFSNNAGVFTEQPENEAGEITLTFDKNYSIYIVFERETYQVVFEVSDIKHGKIKTNGNALLSERISEQVRYGRSSLSVIAVATDMYRNFVGWKIKDGNSYTDVLYTDNNNLTYTLDSQTIKGNTTFVAVFEGNEYSFNIVIKQNSKYDAYENFDNIIKKTDASENYGIGESIYDDVDYTITVPITYIAGDNIHFEIQLNEYYQLIRGGAVSEDKIFAITGENGVTPDIVKGGTYIIQLSLRYYAVAVYTDTIGAFEISGVNWNVSSGVKNTNITNTQNKLFEAEVQYGGTLSLIPSITHGYTCKEQTGERVFEFNSDKTEATITEIFGALEIRFVFVPTRYKITFETNYPRQDIYGNAFDENQAKPQESYVLYIEQDGTIIKNKSFVDARGSETFKSLILSQAFEYKGAIFGFNGWSITPQAINREFFFDEERGYIIYYIDSYGKTIDGFAYPLEGTLDEDDNIAITLYGTWYVPEYSLKINFIPKDLVGEYNYNQYFENLFGFKIENSTEDPTAVAKVFYGITVRMYNQPYVEDFDYYGWSLDNEEEINTASLMFKMPNQDTTINLYYKFKISVKVQESMDGVNSATVNNEREFWCLDGETIKLVAMPGRGFDFAYWLVNGEMNTSLPQEFTTTATEKTEYTAVFIGKRVNLIFNNIEHTTLSAENDYAIVGETIRINVDSVEHGYILQMITINNYTTGVEKDTSGMFYTYCITQDDGEVGDIFIDAIVSVMEVKVQFNVVDNTIEPEFISDNKIVLEIAKILVNENNLTNGFWTYNYAQTLTINVQPSIGFKLIEIKINEQPLNEISELFTLKLTQDDGINIGTTNVVELAFEKIYWINGMQDFIGEGVRDNPYVISSAETLARLAHSINSGILDVQSRKLYFKVTENITLNDKFWIPIGTEVNPFNGVFDLGIYKITGPMFAQSYQKSDWERYCPGVFAYVSADAEIILERSMTPIFVIIIAIVAVAIFAIVVSIIVIKSKKKKIKKLSNNLGITNMQKVTRSGEDESDIEINVGNELEDELKEIVRVANEASAEQKPKIPKKPTTKPSGQTPKIKLPEKPQIPKKPNPPPKKPKI